MKSKNRWMRVFGLLFALSLIAAACGDSDDDSSAETESIVRIFDADGNSVADGEVMGTSELTRHDDKLEDTTEISGLIEGGVYTFWWVAIPADGAFPDDAFVAHGRGGTVAREQSGLVRQRKHLLADRPEELLVISSRKVRPTDGSREYHIAHKSDALVGGVEYHVARRVPWSMAHRERALPKRKRVAVRPLPIRRWKLGHKDAERRALSRRRIIKFTIIRV